MPRRVRTYVAKGLRTRFGHVGTIAVDPKPPIRVNDVTLARSRESAPQAVAPRMARGAHQPISSRKNATAFSAIAA